jgi:hypothetical protein
LATNWNLSYKIGDSKKLKIKKNPQNPVNLGHFYLEYCETLIFMWNFGKNLAPKKIHT